MKSLQDEYRKQVWEFLEKIKPGKTYTVSKLVKSKNRVRFVEEIKAYMRTWPWQGYISFNHDYSKFYKMHPVK